MENNSFYIDKNSLESIGFKNISFNFFKKDDYTLVADFSNNVVHIAKYINGGIHTLFNGIINEINELKSVLSEIGVKYNNI